MTEQTEQTNAPAPGAMEELPAGAEFSPDFIAEVRRRIGFRGLFLASLLREVTGRFDPVLTSGGRPGKAYDGRGRIAAALQAAIRETEPGRSMAPGVLDRCWPALVAACLQPGLNTLAMELLDRLDGEDESCLLECRPGRLETLGRREAAFWREVKGTEVRDRDGGPPERNGTEAIPRTRVRDSFDSYAQAIGELVLKWSIERPWVTIKVSHCPDSLLEALTDP
ncbi:MAG TPA: hypothetical protein VM238_22830 [Phycisphaerae bacterium]|nr:hypothetical protein [Phycisphaerae bacterium]